MAYFAEDSRVCKHPLFILEQNPPEFSPAGENSARDKDFDCLILMLRLLTGRKSAKICADVQSVNGRYLKDLRFVQIVALPVRIGLTVRSSCRRILPLCQAL